MTQLSRLKMACSGAPSLPDFLDRLGNRMVEVYGENENTDFVHACHRRARELRRVLSSDKKK